MILAFFIHCPYFSSLYPLIFHNFTHHFIAEALTDRDLLVADIKNISLYVFYFADVQYKGFVHFNEIVCRQLFFHAFDGYVHHHFFEAV